MSELLTNLVPSDVEPDTLEKNNFTDMALGSDLQTFILFGASNSSLIPQWWSQGRDEALRRASLSIDMLSSVNNLLIMKLFNLPLKVVPKNNMITSHQKLAEFYNTILETVWMKDGESFIDDMLCSDKGAFFIIEGTNSVSQPLNGPPTSIKHIPSFKILLRNDDEHPYIWTKNNGQNIKLHQSRVIRITQMPKSIDDNLKIGFSFMSRAYNVAQLMAYAIEFGLESLGALESSSIIYGTGTTSKNIKEAFQVANMEATNSGRIRSGKQVYLGLRDSASKIGILNPKKLPDGFDYDKFTAMVIKFMAIAAGVDEDDIAPSSNAGTTKTATLISDQKSKFKLVAWFTNKLIFELDRKFLPSILTLQVGTNQDNINESVAKSLINLARVNKINEELGITNIRESRLVAVKNGSISIEQFERLELEDNRLADGLHIKSLFFIKDESIQKLLNVKGILNPCDILNNDPSVIIPLIQESICNAETVAINTSSVSIHKNAMQAIQALSWLLEEYIDISTETHTTNELDPSVASEDEEGELSEDGNDEETKVETKEHTKSSIPTTRKERNRYKKLRKQVRDKWNDNIDAIDTIQFFEDLEEDYDAEEVLEFISSLEEKQRSKGYKLQDVYKELDELI